MNRAYSVLSVKSVIEGKDSFTVFGVASTPSVDRMGDIVEPKGARFKLPLPLLWQHDGKQPVGNVVRATPNKSEIPVEISIPKITEPGRLKDRIDEAVQSIQYRLVTGLSIGFRALEDGVERLKEGGLKFTDWEWLELSLVTIPANAEASITTIKSLDESARAASGLTGGVVRITPPGASGNPNPKRQETKMRKTYQEQLAGFEAKRASNEARMDELMNAVAEKGETLDPAGKEEYDNLSAEQKSIDEHIVRLRERIEANAKAAKPVNGGDPEEAAESRKPGRGVQVITPKLEKGIGFARYAMCIMASGGNPVVARELAQQHYPEYAPLHNILKLPMTKGGVNLSTVRQMAEFHKAAVAAGTTSDTNHHTSLVNYQDLASEFVEFLRPRTIVGQFGTGNIPALRRVPFNIRVPRQTSKASGYWVGEGKPKPVTSFNTEQITMDFHKAATICVLTDELIRFSVPSAEALVRDEIARAVIERIDLDFIDPSNSGTATVKPASITNGAVAITSAGDTAADVRTDIKAAFAEFIQANLPMSSAVFIMNENVALSTSLIMSDLSTPEFPGITMKGGLLVGIPVLTSQYVPSATVVLVAADQIYLADDGNVSIATSNEASIEMLDSSLVQDATAGTGASLVSMFQSNAVAIRAEREITWRTRRSDAVTYITSANWGGTAGSADF